MVIKHSIFSQVVFRVSALMLLFFIMSFFMLYKYEKQNERDLRDYILADHVQTVATFLKIDEDGPDKGRLIFDMPGITKEFYDSTTEYQYVIRDETGKVLYSDRGTDSALFPSKWPTTIQPYFFVFSDAKGVHYFGSAFTRYLGTQAYLVQVAASENSAHAFPSFLSKTLLDNLAIRDCILYVFLLMILFWTIHRSLKSLNKISSDVSKISLASPGYRLNDAGLPEELRPVVSALNKALEQIEIGVKFERDFIANAAHELRTPLSVIKGRVERIKDKEGATLLLKDIDAFSQLIQKLLDKAKLNGLQTNDFQRVDLRQILENVCMDMGPLLVSEGRSVEASNMDKPIIVLGDEWAIYRAIANLLENVIQHTPKGTAVEITLNDPSISVRDHGPGIPPENHEKIFQSFWRQDASKANSSGLGLNIVKRTMEIHGGSVTVENAPDGGTIFTLKFPDRDL